MTTASTTASIIVPKQADPTEVDQFWKMYYIEQMNKGTFEKENKNVTTREHRKS